MLDYDNVVSELRRRLPRFKSLIDEYEEEIGIGSIYAILPQIVGDLLREFALRPDDAVRDIRALFELTEEAVTGADKSTHYAFILEVVQMMGERESVSLGVDAMLGPASKAILEQYLAAPRIKPD